MRGFYDQHDPDLAVKFVDLLGRDSKTSHARIEVRSFGPHPDPSA